MQRGMLALVEVQVGSCSLPDFMCMLTACYAAGMYGHMSVFKRTGADVLRPTEGVAGRSGPAGDGDLGGGGGSGGAVLIESLGSLAIVDEAIAVDGGLGGRGAVGNHGGDGGSGVTFAGFAAFFARFFRLASRSFDQRVEII